METYRFLVTPWDAPDVHAVIEIRSQQTLEELHRAIRDAFGAEEDRPYAFFMNNELWTLEFGFGAAGTDYQDASKKALSALRLRPNKRFLYVFDFDDEVTFDARFVGVGVAEKGVSYPQVLESVGLGPEDGTEEEDDSVDENPHDHSDVVPNPALTDVARAIAPFVAARDQLQEQALDGIDTEDAEEEDDDDTDEDEDDDADEGEDDDHDERDEEDASAEIAAGDREGAPHGEESPERVLEEARWVDRLLKESGGDAGAIHVHVEHHVEGDVMGWLLEMPERLHMAGELDRAAELCQTILDAFPADALILRLPYYLASAHLEDPARNALAKNLEEYPEESRMLASAGLTYIELGEIDRAEQCLREALANAGADRDLRDVIADELSALLEELDRGNEVADLRRSETNHRRRWSRYPGPSGSNGQA